MVIKMPKVKTIKRKSASLGIPRPVKRVERLDATIASIQKKIMGIENTLRTSVTPEWASELERQKGRLYNRILDFQERKAKFQKK